MGALAAAGGQAVTQSILDAPLPQRWGRAQRWKNTLIYGAVRLACAIASQIPLWLLRPVAAALGHGAWLCAAGERKRALKHLRAAFPQWPAEGHKRVVRRMFCHLAIAAAEMARLPELLTGDAGRMPPAHRELLADILAQGRGAIAVTGHIGNWELLAQMVAHNGFDITTIAKPLYDPRLTRFVQRRRSAGGLKIIWRDKNAGGTRELLRAIKGGGILAMLIDQDTTVPGTFVPFFGRPAHTPRAAAALALRTGVPVIVGWNHRHGGQHRFHFERCPLPQPSGDRETDVRNLTALLTQRLEEAIRKYPEQWVWMHRRWRKCPPEPSTLP